MNPHFILASLPLPFACVLTFSTLKEIHEFSTITQFIQNIQIKIKKPMSQVMTFLQPIPHIIHMEPLNLVPNGLCESRDSVEKLYALKHNFPSPPAHDSPFSFTTSSDPRSLYSVATPANHRSPYSVAAPPDYRLLYFAKVCRHSTGPPPESKSLNASSSFNTHILISPNLSFSL
ncbi:hypothetical protein E2542_SST24685 [Spatholobus suberectus]|nr:hypothetical protein E2542_SST24685 [Spatholobus suberectus]